MKYATAMPYIASYVLVRQNGKLAFVLRQHTSWMNGFYGLPSGKVERSESFLAAAIREAKEEIGIDIEPTALHPVLTMHRRDEGDPENENTWVDIFFEVSAWSGEPYNAEPDKHSELSWLDPAHLPKNVIPSLLFALEQIQAGKSYAEFGWEEA